MKIEDRIIEEENEETESEHTNKENNNNSMHIANGVQRISFPAISTRLMSEKHVQFSGQPGEDAHH